MTLTQISSRGVEDTLRWSLGASGSDHYTFTGPGLTGTVNDPTIYLSRGQTYIFENNNGSNAHPFQIQSTSGQGGTAYNTGVTNNGGAGGTEIKITVPHDAPDILYYQCTAHPNMGGTIFITGAVAAGSITTTKIADTAVTLAKLEHGTGSNDGKFLRANNGADPTFETVNTDLVGDTTPQLGGNLDVNTRNIEFGDSSAATQDRLTFGAGDDLHMYHDGSDSFIKNSTGHLRIYGSGTDDKHIYLQPDDGDNGVIVVNNGGVKLYHSNVEKAETVSGGFTVTGTCTATAFAGDGSALTGITSFVAGMIILWSGASNAIPTGWVLCDGNNSTPDLRDRFVIGAGNNYSVGATGGATTDTVSITVSGTTGNNANGAAGRANYIGSGNSNIWSHSHSFSGSGSDTVNTLPPYYALCYIMKS